MGLNIWSLLIILVIVLLLFGTKKLRNMGGDVGGAIKGFKDAMKEGESGREGESAEDASEASEGQLENRSTDQEPEPGGQTFEGRPSEKDRSQSRDRDAS